ncbi:hypothetical protein P5V15_013383 [Pogonomyrmex californicus]
MEKHEEQASGVFNNFELKRRLCDFRRRRLLKKLENDLRELGLSRWAIRRGLMQLIIKPYVILRRVPDSYREKIFQYSNQNLLSNHKEILQSKQNDMEKKQQTDSSQDIHHKETQIPSNITISSNSIMDGNKICQNKIHESSSSRKMLSSGTIQNSVQEVAKKNFHIDNNVTRNHKDISAEKLNTNATSTASLSKNELLSKHAQHFIHKSVNKSSCSGNKIFLKDKSTSISTKSTNISVTKKYVLSEDKSSETTEPIQLKKHCLDSKNSIDFSKDNAVFAGKNKEKQKSETDVKEFSSEKIKLVDTFVQENFDKSRNDNSFPKSSSNTIISELKSCSKKKVNDSRNKNQNAISEKYMQASQGNLELLAEEIGMPLNHTFERKNMNQIQINLKSKNLQRNNLFIDMSSKIKKRTNSENLDENTSLTKIRKRKKTDASPDKKMIDNNAKISNYEILSDNECDHGKQRSWENVTKCMVKERKHKLVKRKSELCRKERNKKIKKIQDKFHDYFRDTFDPDTSENEEECEILLNCFERKKQYFDNLLYDTATTDYEAEDISKMNKYSIHKSTNNSQNDIESAASVKIKFSNICDSTTCTEKYDVIYDAVTDEETEDKISAYKRSISATTSQENVESTILARIKSEDSLCNSITSTEDYATLVAATDEKIKDRASIHDTLINNSQKDTESAIPIEVKSDDNNLCDSNASIEKCYAMYDNATDEKDKISIYECGMSINNFQENIENEIPIEINSDDSSCASTISTEKYYAIYDIIANEKIKDEPLICESDMSVDNSQKNMENMTQTKVKSDDSSCNSAASTEKCYTIHDIKSGPSIYGSDIYGSINNSQENFVNAILTKIKSINKSCDFIASTETCYAGHYVSRDATTKEKIKYKTPMCKSSTSINNSQKNIVDAILIKIKSINKSCDFIASTETCYAVCHYAVPHNAPRYVSPYITVNEKRKDEVLTCESSTSTNSQENIKNAIPTEAKSNDGSFDSTASSSTGNYYATHISTTDEKIKDKVSTCKPDTSFNNLQENIKNVIQTKISHDRSCDSTASTEYYDRHNATTDEKLKDEALCDSTDSNSQENKQSATSLEKKTENARNFFIHAEKYYTRHDVTIDNKIKDRLSIREHNVLTDNSQENINNVMMTTQQLLENSSLIFNTENINKDHTYAHNEIIVLSVSPKLDIDDMHSNKDIEKKSNIYTITEKANMQTILQNQKKVEEMHDVEIIDLTNEDAKTQNDAMPNLELSTTFTHESISCDMDKKDGCNRSQNTKDGQIVEQSSVIKSESNSPKSRHDIITVNSSTSSSKSNSSDDHSSDSHLEDNDNNSDIEVEIKIKPKWKSRVSRKFSIKAPWSAVNSCIKNLHTLKDNPSFLELFQMNHKTSFERFQQGITNSNSKNSENNTLNLNQDVTAECIESVPSTKKDICDSNPITKDNYSQEKFQDYAILVKDKNVTMDCNQEGNEQVQSVKQKTQITVENNLELNKFVCDVPNLRAQLQASTNDKEKINEEQISHDNTLERIESTTKHNQREQNESMTSIEKQKTQLTGNNTGSAKAACDTNTGEQLPSLDVTHNKVRVRSIEELNYQRCTTQTINHDPSITSNIACPKFLRSVFSQLAPSQSVSPQSVPSQSIPLQLVSPLSCQTAPFQSVSQSAPSQSTLPQSALAQSSSQSVSPQSVFKQRPSHNNNNNNNNNVKEGYSSSKTGTETKSSNISNDLINSQITTQIVTENIYNNFLICRNLSRYNLSPTHLQKMNECLKQIRENMEKLKMWHQLSFQDVVVFINQTMQLSPPISELEYNTYIRLYTSSMTRNSGQYDATANTLQYSNITEAFYRSPETSVSNVNPYPFSNARMSNNSNFAQSLITPCLTPTIPNINQQQFLNNSANSSQVPYLRQTAPNIRQQYMRYALTVHSSMPKINQQPPFRNTNHLIQGQRMSSANMSNVSNQQIFENMNNVSSTSNINMRSYGLISQGNINTSPHMKQLCVASKSIINNTTTISATNVQQQRQVYSQTSQNSGTMIYPPSMTNQNVPLRMQQTAHNVISESFITNSNTSKTDVAMGNVRPGNITRQSNCNLQISQVFSKETQSLSQYNQNPNNIYVMSSQPACSNTQANPVRNILTNPNTQQKMQQNQRVNQSKDSSINNTSTNAQQNVPKKRRKSKSQNKTQSINSQDVSQNTSGIILKTSIPQGSDIPHKSTIEYDAMLKTFVQKDKTISISPNTLALSKIDKTAYNFNLAILTDIQKIVLRDQIKLYFLISSKLQHLFTRQEFDGAYQEKSISMLLHLYHHLDNYINEIRSQITRKDTENWQNSQNISMLQNVRTEMSSDKLTKSQSDKNNENNSECDRNSEKQSSEENNNSIISTNSVTVVKNNVSTEIQNKKSAFTALKSTIIKESLPTSTKLQEQNSDILKEKLNKPSLLDAKRKERHKNLETLLLRHSKTPEDNSVTEMSHMNSETEMQSNIKINEIFSRSLTKSSYGQQIPESRSPSTQDSSNLLRGALTNEIVSQVEIAKSNIKEGSNNTKEESIREIPSIITSNNARENDTISQSYNKEDQNKKVNYAINEIARKNSQDVISDDIMENTEILNSTVSDPSNELSNNLTQSSLNVCLISPVKKCKSVETLHTRTVREEHARASDFSLNTQQKDLTNERSNTSSVETSDSFGELYIDESADTLQQEQHDQVASEEDKLNMSQDSAHSFDAIKLESTEATSLSFLLRNIAEKDLVDIRQNFVTEEVEKFNVKSPLKTREMQLPKISKKLETSEDRKWIESIPLTDIVEKQIEDKSEQQCSLKMEEMQFEEVPLKFEVPSKSDDASSIEDSDTIQWIDLKLSEDEEEEKVDAHTHSGIKIINEQLKQVSEPKYYEKSQTFALKDNPIDVNEGEVSTENDILNVDYVECISEESDDSEMRIANILNVGSISPSLFERMNNDTTVVEKDLEAFADENGEKSLYINNHLESTDEVDERPCLRCKRKSTVYCQACLEAHYCSKRCSSLHWKAEHYKQCKGRNDSVICIDV